MQFSLATALVAAASLVQASALVERNLAYCGERGPCVTGASCVNNFCICGNGWMADPTLLPNSALAGYQSCIDHDECLIPSDNICADKASGGVCVDWNPPVKYQCSCDTNRGFIPTEMDPVFGATACEKVNFFQRASVFKICEQMDKKCDTDAETIAQIVTASEDGMTLIYTDSEQEQLGFVDVSDISAPKPLGTLNLEGEPTSVATKGVYALVAINTSKDYVNTAGILEIVLISSQKSITQFNLGGQPDSVSVSPDGNYAVVVIENERNEYFGDGEPPQLPAGFVYVIDCSPSNPLDWVVEKVELTGLPNVLFPTDPEPEFVSINSNNVAVVTLQENNALVLIDLKSKNITASYSAGNVTLTQIDLEEEDIIDQSGTMSSIPREPDGIVWIDDRYFVTADEGDLNGGSRGFTIFDSADGSVLYTSGNTLDHMAAKYGHYPDERSGNKGNEPENVAYGTFQGHARLFVNSERSSVVFVYDVTDPANPVFIQVLPVGAGPEGGVVIPSRNLYVVASEVDSRAAKIRSTISIYECGFVGPTYPTLESSNRADGTPIPWGAMSGLAAEIRGNRDVEGMVYSVEDSFYKKSRLFYIDASAVPAVIIKEYRLTDSAQLMRRVAFGKNLVNADLTVNLDLEGIAVSRLGGFWICSEGSGTVGDTKHPIKSLNYLLKVSDDGKIDNVITLPKDVNDIQMRFGFKGCAEGSGDFANKVVVAFQRAWGGEDNPRLGLFDFSLNIWTFYYYPLDAVESQREGWVGLSDIAPLGDGGKFLVLERDNQGGPDAEIKRMYEIDLGTETPGTTISKTLVRDVVDDILEKRGLLLEKIDGLAVTQNGAIWIMNDNDGVSYNSGETQLLKVTDSAYRPLLLGSPPGYQSVTFVHINDHHSHFDEQSLDLRSSTTIPPGLSVTTSNLRVYYGGFDRAVTLMNDMAAEAKAAGNDVVKLHAGDALTGTLYYTFFGPEADAAAMNVAGFDALTIGNHEFDEGDANLANFAKLLNETTFLSANLMPGVGSALNALTGEDKIQKYYIKILSNGQKLGICGITIKFTTELSSFPDPGTTLADEVDTAKSCVAELQAMGINKIGLLTHVGYSRDIEWFTDIPGVSFIVGGHSHSLLGGSEFDKFNFPTRGPYSAMINNVCVVAAWEYVRVVGALTIEFDTEGNVAACTGAARVPLNPDRFVVRDANPRFDLGAEDAAKATAWLERQTIFVEAVEDPNVVAVLQPFVDQLSERAGDIIANVPEPVCHTYGEEDKTCPGKEIRSRLGGGVCNLVSRGFLFNVPTADVAIQNRGGCRTDMLKGPLTFGNAFEILPFSNTLVTLVMAGDQIRRVIEDSINFFLDANIGGGGGSYAFAAGLRYDINYTAAFGSRITNLEVNKRLEETWGPINLTATYTVVTNNYIAAPRDGYFTFAEIDHSDPAAYEDTYILYAQSFIDFAKNQVNITDPPLSEYSTQKIIFLDGTTFSVADA